MNEECGTPQKIVCGIVDRLAGLAVRLGGSGGQPG